MTLRLTVATLILVLVCAAAFGGSTVPGTTKYLIRNSGGAFPTSTDLAAVNAVAIRQDTTTLLVRVPATAASTFEARLNSAHFQYEHVDNWDLLLLPGRTIDTRVTPPPAIAGYDAGLYIVQLDGTPVPDIRTPIFDRTVVVDYMPQNAYLVRATAQTISALAGLDAVQWTAPYEASMKYQPDWTINNGHDHRVILAGGDRDTQIIAALAKASTSPITTDVIRPYTIVGITADATLARAFLDDPDVVGMEVAGTPMGSAEREDLNLTRASFTGNTYRNWLTTAGVLDTSTYKIAIADSGFCAGQIGGMHPDFMGLPDNSVQHDARDAAWCVKERDRCGCE